MNNTTQPSWTTPLIPKESTSSSSSQKRQSKSKPEPAMFKPLTKECRMEALLYIKACEQEGRTFQNFEQQVIDRLNVVGQDGENNYLGDTFIELVIAEVQGKNRAMKVASWNLLCKGIDKSITDKNREKAQKLWGKTTKFHALIYRDFINNELAKRGITHCFPKSWIVWRRPRDWRCLFSVCAAACAPPPPLWLEISKSANITIDLNH